MVLGHVEVQWETEPWGRLLPAAPLRATAIAAGPGGCFRLYRRAGAKGLPLRLECFLLGLILKIDWRNGPYWDDACDEAYYDAVPRRRAARAIQLLPLTLAGVAILI